jgi:hypothetical protein
MRGVRWSLVLATVTALLSCDTSPIDAPSD